MKKILIFLLFIIVGSCNNLEYIYSDDKNLTNPLFEKTNVIASGVDLVFINSYIPTFFGSNKKNEYTLYIHTEEKKTKRSIEKNQSTTNIKYELRFLYSLQINEDNCISYENELVSNFSIIPKSSGYNYGADAALEKKYELAITNNLNRFIFLISEEDIYSC
tara:strand:+ start:1670 stop:2155 length:486 start_codon:yes stop_codon:yes gene_type:complete